MLFMWNEIVVRQDYYNLEQPKDIQLFIFSDEHVE